MAIGRYVGLTTLTLFLGISLAPTDSESTVVSFSVSALTEGITTSQIQAGASSNPDMWGPIWTLKGEYTGYRTCGNFSTGSYLTCTYGGTLEDAGTDDECYGTLFVTADDHTRTVSDSDEKGWGPVTCSSGGGGKGDIDPE